jgi:RES domain-containing protein
MRAFRIADRRHPIFDGTGARLVGGRWNSPGHPLIYTSETYAGALLEVLVHANIGRVPETQAWIAIEIPDAVSREVITSEQVSGWDADDQRASRAAGDRWLEERRSAVLLVPSLVSGGLERNVLINPAHPDCVAIAVSGPYEVRWDRRLFRLDKAR